MKKRMIQLTGKALALFGAVLLFSCAAHQSSAIHQTKIFYSDTHFIHLLRPEIFKDSVEIRQRIAAVYGEKKFSAESWMALNDTSIHLMIFSPVGSTIAEIVYTKDSLGMESHWMNAQKLKPEYVIADIEFAYYPAKALEENFHSAGFHFVETVDGSRTVRTLFENGKLLLKMERDESSLSIENFLRGYSYRMETEK